MWLGALCPWWAGDDHDRGCLENKLPTGECIEGCNLAFNSSVDVCPLDELSTSETPESAGLGGKEPENFGTNDLKNVFRFYWSVKVSNFRLSRLAGNWVRGICSVFLLSGFVVYDRNRMLLICLLLDKGRYMQANGSTSLFIDRVDDTRREIR